MLGRTFGALLVVCTIGLGAQKAEAQATRASLGDSLQVTAATYSRLFAQIPLSGSERERAHEAILRAFVRRQDLRPIATQAKWDNLMQIYARRDSLLLSLVTGAENRKTLGQRLQSDRPVSSRFKS